MYGCGKDCLILIPFRLPQISCFTLSLKHFSSVSDNCPDVEIGLLPAEGRSSPVNTPVFPPSSFILQSSVWFCIFFSGGQVLCLLSAGVLDALVFEDVFLMHLLRSMNSMFTSSSAILFSPLYYF